MGVRKVVLGNGEVLIDLTTDTVRADVLLKDYTAHGFDGELVTGTCTYDADTSAATATDAEILLGKTAVVKGTLKTGTMPNNSAVAGKISTKDGSYVVPQGYHDGSGTVAIDAAEQAKLIPGNIKQGITVLGVVGTHEGSSSVVAQSKAVTPTFAAQSIVPDDGYDYLSQVTVSAIPVVRSEDADGGTTVTIG